ncbi:hypothetical protein PIB30_050569 [Stylosanthes scabra]|uniref:GRF-type domain-containing protein n=1 Tax=Stylosanthes scabra TaxID=79078 RepID=A0ABU6RHQ3_9FABA|nr:hypothetical protein [Stylosanthes scabra]
MSSGSSMSRSDNGSSHRRRPLLCSHGLRPVLHVSLKKDNPGRRFWGCVYYDVHEECSFFSWADPDSETLAVELDKMEKRVDLFKLKCVVSDRRFNAAFFVRNFWMVPFLFV